MAKISVIMAIYNAEKDLSTSINSFLAQDLKEIELVCINDGSTDHSLDLLEEYAKQDSRIRFVTQENSGSGIAKNKGMKLAKGEYLCFLDADDQFVDGHALETLYHLAKKYDAEVAGGSLSRMDHGVLKGTVVDGIDYAFKDEHVLTYHDLQQAFYFQRFIFSRDMLLSNHIQFPNYRRFQDAVFLPKALSASNKIAVTNKATYLYSVPDSNKFNQFSEEMVNDFLQGHIDILHFAQENHYDRLFAWCLKRFYTNKIVKNIMETSIAAGNTKIQDYICEVEAIITQTKYPLLKGEKEYLDVFSTGIILKQEKQIIDLCKSFSPQRPYEKVVEEPLVSFIVPAYNVEKYIDTSIQSILQQTYQNFEVLCINDGSTDQTLSLLEKWKEKDDRIIIVNKSNGGISSARNIGITMAKGKYVRFVDSDDAIPIESTSILVSYAEKENLDLISFDGQAVYESYEIAFEKPNYIHYYKRNVPSETAMRGIDLFVFQRENGTYRENSGLFFYRKDFLLEHQLFFKEGILHEDNLYSFHAILKAQRSMCLDETGFIRRVRHSSIMIRESSLENVYGLYSCYTDMKQIVEEMVLDEKQIKAVSEYMKSRLNYAKIVYERLTPEEKEKYPEFFKNLICDFETLIKEPVEKQRTIRNLQKEIAQLNAEKSKKESSIAKLTKENIDLKNQNQQLEKDRNYFEAELHTAHHSFNWRVGKWILFLPKKVYYFFKNLLTSR